MTTSRGQAPQNTDDRVDGERPTSRLRRLVRIPVVRELLVVIAFCLFTSALTWPYVTRIRDAVVDTGDPYLISWILWWDYHQTFTDPLHLFDSNTFYPLKYTLAFSEHSYGIALLFFPLFALGAKPLTVHAVAIFFGFVLSGYGAFRLGRTLTGSAAVGWVAGIVFAFVPHRFLLMSQVAYLFSPWIPLLFEALVLFARARTFKRATWLGFAFFMTGLTTITWLVFSLIPFVVYAAILLTRYGLWRERAFWRRGAVALATASLLLLPFMLPYALVARLYGFQRSVDEVKANSAWPTHWLSVENRNKLWNRMGEGIPESHRFKLFPGLLPILFSLAGLKPTGKAANIISQPLAESEAALRQRRWLSGLDCLIIFAFAISILAIGFDGSGAFGNLFSGYIRSERALTLLFVSLIARLCLAYPEFLRRENANLIETIRSTRRGDAFWLGTVLTVIGFCYPLGWNFFLYRICYDVIPVFKSIRVPARGAMIAYLGLALLSGLGVKRLAEKAHLRFPRLQRGAVVLFCCAALLLELNAAPLLFLRGEVYPDAVTLRLKQTPMRGGIVILPAGADFNHRYMLRAADHQKPLIVGISGFNTPIELKIEAVTQSGTISMELLEVLEAVPTSYVVIENQSIVPERRKDYEMFLARAVAEVRLEFINRFDGHSDLYAVVKTEPEARSEAGLPFDAVVRDWAGKVREDPVNLLGQTVGWSQQLYRIYQVSLGAMPRYKEYLSDLETIGRGVVLGSEKQEQQFQTNLNRFSETWTNREAFKKAFAGLDDDQYLDRLVHNAGISIDPAQRVAMVTGLSNGQETRSTVLLKIVSDPRFVEREKSRSLVLLHYFGYLRRNPDDPPDRDLTGFNFWLRVNPGALSQAFKDSIEYQSVKRMGTPDVR